MAVGKIEYKKILDDNALTPTKLKDLYVSQLKKDPSSLGHDPNWAIDPNERYTIMTPEAAAAMISRRQDKGSIKESVEDEEIPTEDVAEEVVIDRPQYMPIQGGVWPMTINEQPVQTNFTNQSNFVQQMTAAYATELQQRGYDPAFAEYIVAQDALESNWGRSQSGSNNFGGIKGKGTSKRTKEWDGTNMITITDSFRDFDNLQDYIDYKINLVGNDRYNVFAYSPEEYFERMKIGGYATDPNYVSKLNSVLQTVRKHS